MEKSTDEELLAILKKDGIAIEKTADAIANAMKNGLLCFAKFDTLHGAYGFDRVTHYLQLPTIEVWKLVNAENLQVLAVSQDKARRKQLLLVA